MVLLRGRTIAFSQVSQVILHKWINELKRQIPELTQVCFSLCRHNRRMIQRVENIKFVGNEIYTDRQINEKGPGYLMYFNAVIMKKQ